MKVIFYCFSGTGNTRFACERMIKELEERGHEGKLYMISLKSALPAPEGYDCMVAAYPVHAFNAPTPVIKFLKKLPKSNALPVYLLRTSGEPLKLNHASGVLPKRILRRKGYVLRGEFYYVMPYNIIFRHSDGMAARMARTMERRAALDAASLIAGEGNLISNGIFRRSVSFLLRIEHPAMPLIGRTFRVKKSACASCGQCAEKCPQGNIKLVDGLPKFGGNCIGCMSCALRCPKDAIRISVLNGWRVNGEYSFEGEPAADDEVCRYCRKSYLRYFHESENKKLP